MFFFQVWFTVLFAENKIRNVTTSGYRLILMFMYIVHVVCMLSIQSKLSSLFETTFLRSFSSFDNYFKNPLAVKLFNLIFEKNT